jgi:hypothetical protein
MPPGWKRSTPLFWPPLPSGDWLKISKLVHSWAKNGGKSLPCQENVANVLCPEGAAIFYFGGVIGR